MTGLINLCFHGIGRPQRQLEPDEDRYWVSADLFQRVLDEVAGRSDVAISFDDGNASDVTVALPALLARGRTATFFALAGRLGQPGSLGRADLAHLREVGMTVGSHGMDHVPWRGLSPADQQRELVDARLLLVEAAGAPVTEAALPLGRYNRSVLAALRDLGYEHVHTSDRRRARRGGWLQPRYSLHADDTVATLRADVLTPPAPRQTLRLHAVGLVKRLR